MIGATLLAVLVSLLFGALHTTSRSARAGQSRLDDLDARRSAQTFIRRQIEAAVPMTEMKDEASRVLFAGMREELRFVGHLPAHLSGGGLQFLTLTHEPVEESGALVVYRRNVWPDIPFDAPHPGNGWYRETLARDIRRIELSYFGEPDDNTPARWADRWSASDRLPALIRLDVELRDGTRWPRLTIGVRSRTAAGQPHLLRSALDDTA